MALGIIRRLLHTQLRWWAWCMHRIICWLLVQQQEALQLWFLALCPSSRGHRQVFCWASSWDAWLPGAGLTLSEAHSGLHLEDHARNGLKFHTIEELSYPLILQRHLVHGWETVCPMELQVDQILEGKIQENTESINLKGKFNFDNNHTSQVDTFLRFWKNADSTFKTELTYTWVYDVNIYPNN